MIKIIIADDHKLIRDGLKKLFSKELDIKVVAETNDPYEVKRLIKNVEFDILLLDLNFPEKSGLDLLIELKLEMPEIKVLILSMHPEFRYGLRTIKAGAMGYICKENDPYLILTALRRIYHGQRYISPEISEILIDNLDGSKASLHESLSDREFQVLQLLATGLGQSEIAEKLLLSVSTISTYRSRILEKLKLKSNAEIIHYAIEHKIVD